MRRIGTTHSCFSIWFRKKKKSRNIKELFIYDCVCVSEHVSWSFLFSLFIFRNNPRWRTNFRDGHFITVLLDDVVGELSLEVSPQYFPSTRSAEPLTRQLLSTPIRSPPPYLPYTHPPPHQLHPIDLRPPFPYLMGDGLRFPSSACFTHGRRSGGGGVMWGFPAFVNIVS